MSRAIMVQGTSSGVGKSWLCTALCRLYARRGAAVAPFKAQNMSNNAAPARMAGGGFGEIGRAQAVQAEAAGLEPHTDFNPILLKPTSERGADVVVNGRSLGVLPAAAYRARRAEWWAEVQSALARLQDRYDLLIIEGAGSPAEINLQAGDLVNMAVARHTQARVLLAGDIDRGGVFAALLGTLALLPEDDRRRVHGLVINRFRGDPAILAPGLPMLSERAGVPVLGVVPMRTDIAIEAEDSLEIRSRYGRVDICVIRLPTVANFTDLDPLGREPGVGVRYETEAEAIGLPDLLVLPGSRDTLADLRWMRSRELHRVVRALSDRTPILGLCGGLQMLGRSLGAEPGLDLLPVDTRYAEDKRITPRRSRTTGRWLLPADLPVEGYEIHLGRTAAVEPLIEGDGAVAGLTAGTYFHGLFESAELRRALLGALRARRGLDPLPPAEETSRQAAFDAAADLVEAHLDLRGLYE